MSYQPVQRGERAWDRAPELLYLAEECGHTAWVNGEVRDTGMGTEDCPTCWTSDRRTWRQLYVEVWRQLYVEGQQ